MAIRCEAVAVRRTWIYDPVGETHRWIDHPHRCERNAVESGLCWQHRRLASASLEPLRRVADRLPEAEFGEAHVANVRLGRANAARAFGA